MIESKIFSLPWQADGFPVVHGTGGLDTITPGDIVVIISVKEKEIDLISKFRFVQSHRVK